MLTIATLIKRLNLGWNWTLKTVPSTHIQGGGMAVQQQQTGSQPQATGDSIRREEVNAILANQREIVSATRDIK